MRDFTDWLNREPAGPKAKKPIPKISHKRASRIAAGLVSFFPKRTKIAPVGAKAKREAPRYARVTTEYLLEHPTCEIGPIIKAAGFEVLCLDTSTHVHHTRGRGRYKCDKSTFKASCSGECHPFWVHEKNVAAATALGLLLPR